MKSSWGLAPWLIVTLWAVWLVGVIIHGAGFDLWPGQNPDFQSSGSFGDSFGSLASLMAAMAAAGALLTLRQQSEANEKQYFDNNFFGLLDHFQSITLSVDAHNFVSEEDEEGNEITTLNYVFHGHDAFRAILDELQRDINVADFSALGCVSYKYKKFYEQWQDDLGHYFRILYHLFKMIDERCPQNKDSLDSKYYYARLVRAHLSTPELTLLAYNCSCGEGSAKFVKYLKDFHVLHNIGLKSDPFSTAERAFFELHLPTAAFKSPSQVAAESDAVSAGC